jgi:hypothetical protein
VLELAVDAWVKFGIVTSTFFGAASLLVTIAMWRNWKPPSFKGLTLVHAQSAFALLCLLAAGMTGVYVYSHSGAANLAPPVVTVPPSSLQNEKPDAPVSHATKKLRPVTSKPKNRLDSTVPPVQLNNAPNGIAIGGGTVTIPRSTTLLLLRDA